VAVLILDTQALSALARPRQSRGRHERVRAALRTAERRNEPVRVPSAVLVELYRGAGTDEAIDHVLGRGFARVVTTGVRIARIAGHLLAEAGRGAGWPSRRSSWRPPFASAGGLILTHDPADIEMLATNHPNVRVVPV
jgi:predicted nucleic acid-binding protein